MELQAKTFAQVSQATQETRLWVERERVNSTDLQQEADALNTRLARAYTCAQACAQVMQANTTLGVFGASQAGKSYLVSRLAAGEDGQLTAQWDGHTIDFLTHVNPPGHDQEATGFVTRFTHHAAPGIKGYPIRVRVFRECEIAMLLINSFFNDLEQNDISFDLSPTTLQGHLDKCREFAAAHPLGDEGNYFSFEDVVQTADYVSTHSGGRLHELNADSDFWLQARALFPRLNLEGRALFFSFFWKNCQAFNLLYTRVGRELLKLKGAEEIYAPLSTFVQEQDGKLMQRANGTIICISALKHLFEDSDLQEICLDSSGTQKAILPLPVLAAISVEMTFPLSGSCPIDEFDVLDFPGARERRKDQLRRFLEDEKNMQPGQPTPFMREQGSEFIRRGKVAYLFDRYSQRREVDVLLFCIGVNAQQEVSSIVPILNNWIELNAGKTPQERASIKYPPLLCALTRFDAIYSRQIDLLSTGKPSTTAKEMSNALERLSAQGWLNNWDGTPYCHFYPARRPNLGNIPWLIMQDGQEVGVNPDFAPLVSQVTQELLADDLFVERVVKPQEALQALLSPDGGVDRICQELLRHYKLSAQVRAQRCSGELLRELSLIVATLKTYARADGDEAVAALKQEALELGNAFLQIFQIARVFGLLRSALSLPHAQLAELYNAHFSAGDNARRFARDAVQLYRERVTNLPDSVAGQRIAREVGIGWESKRENLTLLPDAATRFAFFKEPGAATAWKDRAAVEKGVRQLLKRLCTQILDLSQSDKCALEARLTDLLQRCDDKNGARETRRAVQVAQCARFLSDFSTHLGVEILQAGNTPQRFFKLDLNLGEGAFTLDSAGQSVPTGEHLLRLAVKRDPLMFPVPFIDEVAQQGEFQLCVDYFNALAFAMMNVNAMGTGETESDFTPDANRQLLAYISALQLN
ncbi:MAG: putative virulence factor [Candidatus Anaerobiospirillum merdipullorum]|uniref:Virulence factor n=1 Tax=Candidatus Anaerobiospirillum merdipullorum TaxID=2838450 RepID=A0A9E2KR38_9GAMM|nr:putative virulence factor [Candidatus Anaerobiospirillum merdipullorum]